MSRLPLSERITRLASMKDASLVVSRDKGNPDYYCASLGINWRVKYSAVGTSIEKALMNLYEEVNK